VRNSFGMQTSKRGLPYDGRESHLGVSSVRGRAKRRKRGGGKTELKKRKWSAPLSAKKKECGRGNIQAMETSWKQDSGGKAGGGGGRVRNQNTPFHDTGFRQVGGRSQPRMV